MMLMRVACGFFILLCCQPVLANSDIPRMLKIDVHRGFQSPSEKGMTLTTRNTTMQSANQSLCVQSGRSAKLTYGIEMPTPSVSNNQWGQSVDTSKYKAVKSVLIIKAIAHDKYADVTIFNKAEQVNRVKTRQIDSQQAQTSLAVPYEKWVKFAGNANSHSNQKTITYSTRDGNRVDSNFYMKVTRLPVGKFCQ